MLVSGKRGATRLGFAVLLKLLESHLGRGLESSAAGLPASLARSAGAGVLK